MYLHVVLKDKKLSSVILLNGFNAVSHRDFSSISEHSIMHVETII